MKLIDFALPLNHLKSMAHHVGWGNGYVAIPEGHPCYKLDYDTIHEKADIDVHGGLTFSAESIIGQPEETKGMWIVGFDCAHLGDSPSTCPESYVRNQAQLLRKQLEKVKE